MPDALNNVVSQVTEVHVDVYIDPGSMMYSSV